MMGEGGGGTKEPRLETLATQASQSGGEADGWVRLFYSFLSINSSAVPGI